jgi:hypothetical protein
MFGYFSVHPMLKSLLLVAAVGGLAGCQASRPFYPTGLYRTAADFRNQQPALPGTKAGRTSFGRKAFVVETAGSTSHRTKIPLDSLWGYAAEGWAYRIFRRGVCKVKQNDTLVIYSQHVGKSTHHYFSAGLTGPVTLLTKKKLQQAFATNNAFITLLKQLKWHESVLAVQQAPGSYKSYRIVALYRQSLGLPTSYQPR